MHPAVFVSHASQDKDAVEKLCSELDTHDVEVWASFKDIPPGAEWDKSIQAALESATHVIVVVSHTSIDSSYVRAEVEYALDNKKMVIPVLIEEVKLPVRWHTLQSIELFRMHQFNLQKMVSVLPKSAIGNLESYLNNSKTYSFEPFRQLLWDNPQWFSNDSYSANTIRKVLSSIKDFDLENVDNYAEIEHLMLKALPGLGLFLARPYSLPQINTLFDILSNLDIFMFDQDTHGDYYDLVYLGEPHELPFERGWNFSFKTSRKFQEQLDWASKFVTTYSKYLYDLGIKYSNNSNITVHILTGTHSVNRDLIQKPVKRLRERWPKDLDCFPNVNVNLDIATYSRLLARVKGNRYFI